jgi:SAM-dependent methyltransferase
VTERFAYDAVPYDTEANPEAHPRSMATLARLFGLDARPTATARVLEIGCGDGEHMIAAASYLPHASFVGFDLAADAVARGTAAAETHSVPNVRLVHLDVRDARDVQGAGLCGAGGELFDFVVAHGVYSWVPESIRADVLAVMRSALAPGGIGFLSVNAGPGWELRRALRMAMREVSAEAEEPAEKVRLALALVDELASAGASEGAHGFVAILAAAANEYRAHVVRATPPDAPFSRYVFHDLLADCNDSFTVTELEKRLAAAGLRIVCETPLDRARGASFPGLEAAMERSGSPFLQVLVQRDDGAAAKNEPDLDAIASMHLWADLAPAPERGAYRTTTGAVLRAEPGSGIARAALSAPAFAPVRSLADDDATRARLAQDLLVASCEGVLSLALDPPELRAAGPLPCVAPYVRACARDAARRGARTAVLTSALHRSFRVPLAELRVVSELDGRATLGEIAERAGVAASLVTTVVDRFARHGFLVAPERGT